MGYWLSQPPVVFLQVDSLLGVRAVGHRPVAEFVLVGRDAKDIGGQDLRGLAHVAVDLVHPLRPVLMTRLEALELAQHQGDAVDQQDRVRPDFLDAGDDVLVGDGEVVEVLPVGVEGEEIDRDRRLARLQHHRDAVAEQVEGGAVGLQRVRVADGAGRAMTARRAWSSVLTAGLIFLRAGISKASTSGSFSGRSKSSMAPGGR